MSRSEEHTAHLNPAGRWISGRWVARRCVARRCIALLGVLVLLCTGGCEESLPPYAPPEIPLEVEILIDTSVDGNDLGTVDNGFTVTLTHVGDFTNEFVLLAPYEVEVAITISMVETPSRSNTVIVRSERSENLARGNRTEFLMNIPTRDSDGNRWNWPSFAEEVAVILQGKVRIVNIRHDLEINTTREQTVIVYAEQNSR